MKDLLMLPLELIRILAVLFIFGSLIRWLTHFHEAVVVLLAFLATLVWYRRRGQFNGWVRLRR